MPSEWCSWIVIVSEFDCSHLRKHNGRTLCFIRFWVCLLCTFLIGMLQFLELRNRKDRTQHDITITYVSCVTAARLFFLCRGSCVQRGEAKVPEPNTVNWRPERGANLDLFRQPTLLGHTVGALNTKIALPNWAKTIEVQYFCTPFWCHQSWGPHLRGVSVASEPLARFQQKNHLKSTPRRKHKKWENWMILKATQKTS